MPPTHTAPAPYPDRVSRAPAGIRVTPAPSILRARRSAGGIGIHAVSESNVTATACGLGACGVPLFERVPTPYTLCTDELG